MALFSQSEVEPEGIAGFDGSGFIVTDKESELMLFPQVFIPLTATFAIPVKAAFQLIVEFTEVPLMLPAVEGEILHK